MSSSNSMSMKGLFQIPVFDGSREKWPIWKQRVKACMVARGWWAMIEKSGSGNSKAAASSSPKADDASEADEKRVYALSALTLALPDDLMSAYASEEATDPSEVWEKLCGHFESNSMMNKSHLRNKLSTLRMNGSMTYLTYYTEMMMVMRSLKGMGEPMSDAEIAHYLLNGLSPPFYPVKLNLQMGKDATLAVMHRMLTEHAERLLMTGESGGDDGSLFWMGPNRRQDGRPNTNHSRVMRCFTCNQVGHRAFDCDKNKNIKKCTFCRHVGSHTEKECRKKKASANGGAGGQHQQPYKSGVPGNKQGAAKTATAAVVMEEYDAEEEDAFWIGENGEEMTDAVLTVSTDRR